MALDDPTLTADAGVDPNAVDPSQPPPTFTHRGITGKDANWREGQPVSISADQLQAALANRPNFPANSVLPSPGNMPYEPPPVDLGTGNTDLQTQMDQGRVTPGAADQLAGTLNKATDAQAALQPPKKDYKPAIMEFFQQMFGGQNQRGYADSPTGQPGRPNSRLDAFENFLGNFLDSFSQGMAQGGTGPGASGRGFGAAMQAPYQHQVAQYQANQAAAQAESQRQLQAAQAQGTLAEANLKTQEAQPITIQQGPNGTPMTLPASLAKGIIANDISGQWKVKAAEQQKRFITSPYGIFDTKTMKYLGGGAGVKITQDDIDNHGIPQQLLGQTIKGTEYSGYERGAGALTGITQGAQGPAVVNKLRAGQGLGPGQAAASLGLGSPANNPMAQRKQGFTEAKYGDALSALSPHAQQVLGENAPVQAQIDGLMEQFESMKNDNTPFKFLPNRALYAAGVHSNITDLAGGADDTIAGLELNKIVGAARVLKGGSRAIQALQLAMSHLPNVWIDSPKQIYSKLNNIHNALGQIEQSALAEGSKTGLPTNVQSATGITPAAQRPGAVSAPPPGAPPAGGPPPQIPKPKKATGPLSMAEAQGYLARANGDKDKARQMAKADGRSF